MAVTSPSRPPRLDGLRRTLFVGLVLLLTGVGFSFFLDTFADQRLSTGDYIALSLFPLLFSQVVIGCVLALFGFFDRLRGGDPWHLMRGEWREREEEIPLAATAVVIPVYNEDVARVSRGIENMWRSLEKTGQIENFDFYLLSDSNSPDHWVEEECAWLHLCRRLGGFGRIFYRKRRHAIHGKSGNVADFCRRWGRRYRYMIALDADSVMSGPLMVRLVRAMEANPTVGILQTHPRLVLGSSLFRRVRQFSAALYGDIFVRGCSFFQTASGSYWGHNAILRLEPFMEHCGLPFLPVPDRSQRHILSHDTVEAALMQKAGYEVWIAGEEEGSYEEGPPNLSDMLKRDRRWCAGNLQHFWFLFAHGISLGSRLQIWIGLMAYLSSPLWLGFLLAGSWGLYDRTRFLNLSAGPEELGALGASASAAAIPLGLITLFLLFLPQIFGLFVGFFRRREFGGFAALLRGIFLETALSILTAPVLMVFHTIFVAAAILKIQIQWSTQNRVDHGLSWSHCLKAYGWLTPCGVLAQLAALHWLGKPGFWLAPICLGWVLAPLLAWYTARGDAGAAARRAGLFLIPEEIAPPQELEGLAEETAAPEPDLWAQAILCPYVLAVHLSMMRRRLKVPDEETDPARALLRQRLVEAGPAALDRKDRFRLLGSAGFLVQLHRTLWAAPEAALHPDWRTLMDRAGKSFLLRRYLVPAERS
ncbi:MAG: glucans biosynthesis glucosyltransferase MdoH [Verrucomicrobium sp.]|nr:glucans biosynthesis glucosyltransferase MdoH [Verrucomicrobium sp.]